MKSVSLHHYNKHAAARRLQSLLVAAVNSQYDVEAAALRMGYNIMATNIHYCETHILLMTFSLNT